MQSLLHYSFLLKLWQLHHPQCNLFTKLKLWLWCQKQLIQNLLLARGRGVGWATGVWNTHCALTPHLQWYCMRWFIRLNSGFGLAEWCVQLLHTYSIAQAFWKDLGLYYAVCRIVCSSFLEVISTKCARVLHSASEWEHVLCVFVCVCWFYWFSWSSSQRHTSWATGSLFCLWGLSRC